MVASKKRGGFFGFLKKAVQGIGSFVGGLFGGAKKTAHKVANRAITRAKEAGVEALQTGNIKGVAKRAFAATKKDAISSARTEMESAKSKSKAAATSHINAAYDRYVQRMQGAS